MDDPAAPGPVNMRCDSYWIASAGRRCASCGENTRVVALALPPGHETLEVEATGNSPEDTAEDTTEQTWQTARLPAVLFGVYRLAAAVERELQRRSIAYRPTAGIAAAEGGILWGNHCEHCGAPQDEEELHCEPDGAFMPASPDAGARIRVEAVAEPLWAGAAGYAPDPLFFPRPAVS